MTQTLYGDVLFFVNFTMDFLTLFITARILHVRVRAGRMAFSAAVGGIYGVAACFMGGMLIFRLAINVAVSVLMCYIAFGEKLIPCCALFYGAGCLLGGVMTAVYGAVNKARGTGSVNMDGRYQPLPGELPLGWMAVTAVLAALLAVFAGRLEKKRRGAKRVTLGVTLHGKTVSCTGICDSGNLLTDPISGAPVIVAGQDLRSEILPETDFFSVDSLPPDAKNRIRMIPCGTVGGGSLLPAIRPDSVLVDGIEKNALIAFSEHGAGFDGADALVPYSLI